MASRNTIATASASSSAVAASMTVIPAMAPAAATAKPGAASRWRHWSVAPAGRSASLARISRPVAAVARRPGAAGARTATSRRLMPMPAEQCHAWRTVRRGRSVRRAAGQRKSPSGAYRRCVARRILAGRRVRCRMSTDHVPGRASNSTSSPGSTTAPLGRAAMVAKASRSPASIRSSPPRSPAPPRRPQAAPFPPRSAGRAAPPARWHPVRREGRPLLRARPRGTAGELPVRCRR